MLCDRHGEDYVVGAKAPGPQAWLGSNQTANNDTSLPAMGVRHLKADPPAPIFSRPWHVMPCGIERSHSQRPPTQIGDSRTK